GNDIIFAKAGTGSVVDHGFIYCLNAGIQSIHNYVEVAQGYELDYTGTSIIGTGTVINAVKDSEVCEHCIVVIFGDVNGDGVYDGTDAIIVNCIANGMLTKEQVGEAVYMAADCNHDGVIDNLDVELLQQAGVLLASVGQNKTQEELQTSSNYTEYLNLIDQNPVNEDKESYIESESTPSNSNQILDFLSDIIAFIKNLINFIKTIFA
ncbi:MAG: dockerin type I repeat-containing protein, partial [Ruminococcus sp.]|nr:dockerin type I repeat-containing protein [Candidatus Copronaster equi]